MTVRMLLNSLDSYELTEWIAFCKYDQEEEPETEQNALKNQLLTMPQTVNQKSKFEAIMKEKNK